MSRALREKSWEGTFPTYIAVKEFISSEALHMNRLTTPSKIAQLRYTCVWMCRESQDSPVVIPGAVTEQNFI